MTMTKIIIYTATLCPYCTMAKKIFDRKGASFSEINVDSKPGIRQEMVQKTNRRTVPQIFIGDLHIGGFDDLYILDMNSELDRLLATS